MRFPWQKQPRLPEFFVLKIVQARYRPGIVPDISLALVLFSLWRAGGVFSASSAALAALGHCDFVTMRTDNLIG